MSSSQPPWARDAPGKSISPAAWANRYLTQNEFEGACLSFVRQAWAAGNIPLKAQVSVGWGGDTFPDQIWGHFTSGTTGAGEPTIPGTLIFYAAGPGGDFGSEPSHVQIFIGNNTVISTEDSCHGTIVTAVHAEAFGAHPREIGWWLPAG